MFSTSQVFELFYDQDQAHTKDLRGRSCWLATDKKPQAFCLHRSRGWRVHWEVLHAFYSLNIVHIPKLSDPSSSTCTEVAKDDMFLDRVKKTSKQIIKQALNSKYLSQKDLSLCRPLITSAIFTSLLLQ